MIHEKAKKRCSRACGESKYTEKKDDAEEQECALATDQTWMAVKDKKEVGSNNTLGDQSVGTAKPAEGHAP